MRLGLRLALAFALAFGVATASAAAAPEPTPQEQGLLPGMTPGPRPPTDRVDELAREVSSGLRCPVCQGLSVADSNSAAATQMHDRIRELVGLGYDRVQIEDYFVSRYGEWVLLEPRSGGLNVVVWFGPVAGLALALLVATSLLRPREREEGDPDTIVDDAITAVQAEDPYTARLLAEVDDD